jgi:hypothetical protein
MCLVKKQKSATISSRKAGVEAVSRKRRVLEDVVI